MSGAPGLLAALAIGWAWGSFLNQLIDRLPPTWRALRTGRPAPDGAPTLLRPRRSVCAACRRALAWYDNLPVVSWLALRGRCRHCGAPIGLRTLVVEAATPTGFAALVLALDAPAAVLAGWAGLSAVVVAAGLAARRTSANAPAAGRRAAGKLSGPGAL